MNGLRNEILILCLVLCLCSCRNTCPNEPDTAKTTDVLSAETVNVPVEPETIPTAEEITVTDIRNTAPPDMDFPDETDPFWEENGYIFFFTKPISEYMVVEYSDGSTQGMKDALQEGRITTHDIRSFGIQIYSRTQEQLEPTPPCGYGSGTAAFDNIREMIRQIETGTLNWADQEIYDTYGCDTAKLRELSGLCDGFSEFLVEWTGGLDYCINYQKDEQTIAFMPYYTEEQFAQALSGMDTWESLSKNTLLLNLEKTELETDAGVLYVCTFDTSAVPGQRITCHESIGPDGIRRIVTNWYGGDGEHISGSIYVFAEEVPFVCLVSGFPADMAFAEGLRMESVK